MKKWPDNLCPNCGLDFVYHRRPTDGVYDCDYARQQVAKDKDEGS